jgi:hypothetical protein
MMKIRKVFGTRVLQFALFAGVAGLGIGSGLTVSSGGGAATPETESSTAPVPNLPDQVPVDGPSGYVGTVAKSDIAIPPPLTAAGIPPPPSAYPGASIVLKGEAGYPVMNNGDLAGYWVPGNLPSTFVTVSQAESENAVPSQGASAVGTATAVTPTPPPIPAP